MANDEKANEENIDAAKLLKELRDKFGKKYDEALRVAKTLIEFEQVGKLTPEQVQELHAFLKFLKDLLTQSHQDSE